MRARLSDDPLDAAALIHELSSATTGGVSVFIGVVRSSNDGREVTMLSYSAYEPMALDELHRIMAEASEKFGVTRITLEHRLGDVAPGAASVVVAAAHEHRSAAIAAVSYMIEALKARVPIWKRETYADGTARWLASAPPHEGEGVAAH